MESCCVAGFRYGGYLQQYDHDVESTANGRERKRKSHRTDNIRCSGYAEEKQTPARFLDIRFPVRQIPGME